MDTAIPALPYWLHSTISPDGSVLSGADLAWMTPEPVAMADGRVLDGDFLAGMLAEWRHLLGGELYLQRLTRTLVRLTDEDNPYITGSRRSYGEASDIAALCDHALGRALAARANIPSPAPADSRARRITTYLTLTDAAVVMIAALDRHLAGAGLLIAWYLQSPCSPNCPYHGAGSRRSRPGPRPEPLDLTTLPPPCWYLRTGTVESDPLPIDEHGDTPFERHRRLRPPSPATVPPGLHARPTRGISGRRARPLSPNAHATAQDAGPLQETP